MSIKNVFLLFLCFCFFTCQAEEKLYTTINDKSKLPILSPSLKNRKTKKIRLNNGLEAYLISDPHVELSGAMLSVGVGSWEDPIEHPGLAHFLEHMLFLGTKKYPNESEYQKFVSENGGQANAFTTNSSTNYLFTISNNAFPEALDRFSMFFKEPLFNVSGVSRELHAIDQEYAKNLEEDNIRQIYVLKEQADPNHPYHQFNMGNSQTLSNVTRETLKEWFHTHYSANLMKLVVYSSEPLEDLVTFVAEDFSEIPNNNRSPYVINYPAFEEEKEKTFVYIKPIKDTRSVTLVWELPIKFSHLNETRPAEIVSYILGHEGEKSLLAQLKRENLAESLAAGGTKLGNDLTLFYIEIELTSEGLQDIDQVITRTFQAIKNLKDKGVPRHLFEEIHNMATIDYQFQSKENEFMMLMKHAFQIQDENLSTYPEHTKIVQQYSATNINELLQYLTPKNAFYFIMAPSKATGITLDQKEEYLRVVYGKDPIDTNLLNKWKHVDSHPEIDLPPPNIFIPDNLKLVYENIIPSKQLIPEPIILVDNQRSRIYFAHDDRFGVPKISWLIKVKTPQISMDSAENIVFADLYVKEIKDSLNKISYLAKMAGLEYDITREKDGLKIKIEGYSQNAERLLKEVLQTLKSYTPDMTSFKFTKDSLLRKYQNFTKETPLEQSIELFKSVLYEKFVTEKEKAAALRKASFKRYKSYVATLYEKTYIEATLFGNMKEDQGKLVAKDLENTFDQEIYFINEQLKNGVVVLPQDKGPFYLEERTKSLGNAALLAIEDEPFSFKKRASQEILMQAIKEPFFSALRTKQQTGYLVHSFPQEIERKLFNIFAVQSNTHDVRDLLSRFEQFIEGYTQEIGKTELLKKQFDSIKDALIKKYNEPAKNITQMAELLNTLAFDYDGDFEWLNKRLNAFKTLSYDEFLKESINFIGRDNKRRLAILLKGEIPKENEFTYTRASTGKMIRKVSEYEWRNGG